MRTICLAFFSVLTCLAAESFNPDAVKVVGELSYGKTSAPVPCSAGSSYCAFVFNGHGDDRVEVIVKADEGTAFVAIADGTLSPLTNGANRIVFTLPNRGPDAEAYYIVFRDKENKPGRFTVALKKVEK